MKENRKTSLTFSELLEDALHTKDIKKNELARQLGIEPSTISNWCNRKGSSPDYATLLKICTILDVDLLYLIGGTRPKGHISEVEWNLIKMFRSLDAKRKKNIYEIITYICGEKEME